MQQDSAFKTKNESSLSFRAVMYGGQIQFSPTLSVAGTDDLHLINTDENGLDLNNKPASVMTQDVLKFEEE